MRFSAIRKVDRSYDPGPCIRTPGTPLLYPRSGIGVVPDLWVQHYQRASGERASLHAALWEIPTNETCTVLYASAFSVGAGRVHCSWPDCVQYCCSHHVAARDLRPPWPWGEWRTEWTPETSTPLCSGAISVKVVTCSGPRSCLDLTCLSIAIRLWSTILWIWILDCALCRMGFLRPVPWERWRVLLFIPSSRRSLYVRLTVGTGGTDVFMRIAAPEARRRLRHELYTS